MSQNPHDFSEDEGIMGCLNDPVDIEAFTNLMAHAHEQGMSAADFVREEPRRTSRKAIRKLCLKNQIRSLKVRVASVLKNLWDRPVEDPGEAYICSLYYPKGRPPGSGRNGQQGKG